MRKRKKYGYILLTMLIVSGLAGTTSDNSLTKKERKFTTDHLKETKALMINSIKDLTDAQLNYRSASGKTNAKEFVIRLATNEKRLWQLLESSMKKPANPEKRSEIKMTDEELINNLQNGNFEVNTTEAFKPKNSTYKTLEEAISGFKEKRASYIKYLKNSTEDLRNHVVQTPLGWLDCYQLTLLVSSHTKRFIQQINEVKREAGFPK